MSKQTKGTLLVIEDAPGLQKQMRWGFDGYEVLVAGDRESALAQMRRYEPPVVTMDLGLPPDADGPSEGFATLEQMLALLPETKVIVITGQHDRAHAVRAIGMGAYDFYQKPFDPEILGLVVDRAFRLHELQAENRKLQQSRPDAPAHGIITNAPSMLKVCRSVERVAPSDATVLLLGESGTGKEVLARVLHHQSPRKINTLCDRILLFVYLEEQHQVDGSVVSEVISDLQTEMPSAKPGTNGAKREGLSNEWGLADASTLEQLDGRVARMEKSINKLLKMSREILAVASPKPPKDAKEPKDGKEPREAAAR